MRLITPVEAPRVSEPAERDTERIVAIQRAMARVQRSWLAYQRAKSDLQRLIAEARQHG